MIDVALDSDEDITIDDCVAVNDAVLAAFDRDEGEDVAVGIDIGTFLRLEAERVGQWLVTRDLARGDVHETDGLRRRDNRRDLVVDGEQLKPGGRLLGTEQGSRSDA